jgi:hypothetical protein
MKCLTLVLIVLAFGASSLAAQSRPVYTGYQPLVGLYDVRICDYYEQVSSYERQCIGNMFTLEVRANRTYSIYYFSRNMDGVVIRTMHSQGRWGYQALSGAPDYGNLCLEPTGQGAVCGRLDLTGPPGNRYMLHVDGMLEGHRVGWMERLMSESDSIRRARRPL